MLASFFVDQNSKEDASSNGRTAFFLLNETACGRFKDIYQDNKVFSTGGHQRVRDSAHEVFHDAVEYLACVCAAHEDGRSRIFNFLGLARLQSPFRARILRFSVW